MGDWTFRVFSEPFTLDADEQREVISEIARLGALTRQANGNGKMQVNRNPAGLVGEYASLLIDATVRGFPSEAIVPASVHERYASSHWFAVGQDVLSAFCREWASVREDARMMNSVPAVEVEE